jgi:hypothetical protein
MPDSIKFIFARDIQGTTYKFSFISNGHDTTLQMKMQELVKLHQDGNKKIVFSVSNDDEQRIKDGTHRMVIDVYGYGSSFPLETFKKMTVGSVLEFSSASASVMGTVRVEKNIVGRRDLWD